MTIIKIVPNNPLGPYPQLLLYRQLGSEPIRNKINKIIRIVPNITILFLVENELVHTSF